VNPEVVAGHLPLQQQLPLSLGSALAHTYCTIAIAP
jgi:hypothetical protein